MFGLKRWKSSKFLILSLIVWAGIAMGGFAQESRLGKQPKTGIHVRVDSQTPSGETSDKTTGQSYQQTNSQSGLVQLYWAIGFVSVLCGLISLMAFTMFKFNKRLKQEIKERNAVKETIKKERDFMAAVLSCIESIVVVIDLNGYLVSFNKAAEKCCGYGFEEIKHKPFWEILVPPTERAEVKEVILNVKKQSLPNENVNCWVGKDGKERIIHWFNSALKGRDGSIEYVLCTGLDVTERSEVENALQRSQEHYQVVLENMEEGYFEFDLKGRFTFVNKSAAKTMGYPKTELIGMNYANYMDNKTAQNVFATFNEIFASGKPKTYLSYDIIQKNGEIRTLEVSLSLKLDYKNKPIGFFGVTRDVTERKRLEEMMVQSEKMLSVGGLAAGMAHEINNPLAGMIQTANVMIHRLTSRSMKANQQAAKEVGTTMEAISSFMESRGIRNMLEAIRISGARAAEIVANMLSFSRKSDTKCGAVNLAYLINQTLDIAGSEYDLKNNYDFRQIEIAREFDENLPLVACESSKIQQVILNILRNGAEAMQERNDKRIKPQFILRLIHERENASVRIEIEDNGYGMDEETRKRVFEPFFTTKPTNKGTGLGLSVSYFIVTENHGGEMSVDSTLGKGARFIVKLPVGGSSADCIQ